MDGLDFGIESELQREPVPCASPPGLTRRSGGPNKNWTEGRLELLRKYHADGLSHTLIAEQINHDTGSRFTRNAIIGKCNRERLPCRQSLLTAQGMGAPRGPRPYRRKINLAPIELVEPEIPAFDHLGIRFFDLTAEHCRFPKGHGIEATYCGHPPVAGSPYCIGHHGLCYTKPERRPQRIAA